MGIASALDLKLADPETLRRRCNVMLARTVRELNGLSCIPLEEAPPPKQQIIASRSFGRLVAERDVLLEAVASHAARAAQKLRAAHQLASAMQVFLATNQFIPNEPQHCPGVLLRFASPTADSARLIQAARAGLSRIYRQGYRYQKAGVMLLDLRPAGVWQGELIGPAPQTLDRKQRLMAALDALNAHFGQGTLRFAAEGLGQGWAMRRERLTSAYTTDWEAIPVARA